MILAVVGTVLFSIHDSVASTQDRTTACVHRRLGITRMCAPFTHMLRNLLTLPQNNAAHHCAHQNPQSQAAVHCGFAAHSVMYIVGKLNKSKFFFVVCNSDKASEMSYHPGTGGPTGKRRYVMVGRQLRFQRAGRLWIFPVVFCMLKVAKLSLLGPELPHAPYIISAQ